METGFSALETTTPESYGHPIFRWCFAFSNFWFMSHFLYIYFSEVHSEYVFYADKCTKYLKNTLLKAQVPFYGAYWCVCAVSQCSQQWIILRYKEILLEEPFGLLVIYRSTLLYLLWDDL